MLLTLGTFLEDCLALNNENASGFPSEPIRSTPAVRLPLSLHAPSPVLRGERLRSLCVTRSFRLRTRFERSSFPSLQPTPKHTDASTISQSLKSIMIRLLAAVLSPKNPIFYSQTEWRIRTLAVPNRNKITVHLPARILLPMPPSKHVPLVEGPAPEEGTPRVSK